MRLSEVRIGQTDPYYLRSGSVRPIRTDPETDPETDPLQKTHDGDRSVVLLKELYIYNIFLYMIWIGGSVCFLQRIGLRIGVRIGGSVRASQFCGSVAAGGRPQAVRDGLAAQRELGLPMGTAAGRW